MNTMFLKIIRELCEALNLFCLENMSVRINEHKIGTKVFVSYQDMRIDLGKRCNYKKKKICLKYNALGH